MSRRILAFMGAVLGVAPAMAGEASSPIEVSVSNAARNGVRLNGIARAGGFLNVADEFEDISSIVE